MSFMVKMNSSYCTYPIDSIILLSKMEVPKVFSDVMDKISSLFPKGRPMEIVAVAEPVSHQHHPQLLRNEVALKLLSMFLGLSASFAMTYFGIKYLVKALDPTNKDKEKAEKTARDMLRTLGVRNVQELTAYELCMAANLVDPLTIDVQWDDIGGLKDIIENIQETVILPFNRPDLFRNSTLLQAPKGVLLYGPPGCGKTMLAKATAKAAGARFVNLQITSLVDKWYGESQKRTEAIFSLAMKLQPCIIFIDEIDSFLRSRTSTDHEATAMIKTQFMSFWDGLITDPKSQVMVMGATNRPQDVDAAILRRMPTMFHVGLPGKKQRENIMRLILEDENIDDDVDYKKLAELSESFSGSDLREVCRAAAVSVAHEFVQSPGFNSVLEGTMRSINMNDLENATNKVRQTKSLSTNSPLNFHLD